MTNDPKKKIVPDIIPPEFRELQMPSGTPFGLAFLGAARFSAIRRVLDHATQAAQAKANFHTAEGAVANALVHREAAREQLVHLDTIRDEVGRKITEGAYIAQLERELRIIELEDQVAERRAARAAKAAVSQPTGAQKPAGGASDKFASILDDLKRIPELAKTAAAVKAQIIADAGGEDKLDEGQRTMLETIDAIIAAALQAQGSAF
jgi:hypothetical protein